MTRLPQPGSDNGTWGDILNEYLSQAHNSDGTLKTNSVGAAQIQNGTIAEAQLDSAVQIKLNAVAGTPDWSTITNKPAVIAAGTDQTAARTAIGAGTSNLTIGTTNTTAKAGDYTPTKTDVGLGNVDNTSDATKNSTAATLTNKVLSGANNTFSNIPESAVTNLTTDLAAKATDANVVHLTGTETVTGTKTFSATTYTKDVWATPNGGAGNTANLVLDNSNGQVWLNSNNSGGTFAIYDNTAHRTPFAIQPGSIDQALVVSSYGVGAKMGIMYDTSDNTILDFNDTVSGAVNYLTIANAATGNTPSFTADGADTNINFNLVAKGTGTVQANGVPVVTTTGTQTLTNKTISGSANTLSNIPESAVTNLTTDLAAKLGRTEAPIRFSAAVATTGVTATDRAYAARTLTGARMRVAGAPVGSNLVVQVQHYDGSSWTTVGTLTINDGSTVETSASFTQAQIVGNLVRLNVTSVGSTTAATGVAVDVTWA